MWIKNTVFWKFEQKWKTDAIENRWVIQQEALVLNGRGM